MSRPPFADIVRRRLADMGLGLRELCREVGLDPSFFSKVLAGKRSPPSEDAVLRRIAGRLKVDACGLIVSAGRIPAEWSRLWSEPALLEAVQRLCAPEAAGASRRPALPGPGLPGARAPAGAAAAGRSREGGPREAPAAAAVPAGQPFGDELL